LSKSDYVTAFEEDSLGGGASAAPARTPRRDLLRDWSLTLLDLPLHAVVGHILIQNVGGFGKFLMVLLAFSTVSAQIPNCYSGACYLSVRQHRRARR